MKYCPDCGDSHECVIETEVARKADVEIKRLETNRDIEVARITAAAAETITETEAEHDASHAEGVAEGMETTLETITGGGEPEAGPDPVVVVDPGPEPEPEPEPGPEPPPVADDVTPEPEHGGRGWWDPYQ